MALTPEQIAEIEAARERLLPYLKPGVIITHTRCLGVIEEHFFTGFDGLALCGKATPDSIALGASSCGIANDISPRNVTHINRFPVEELTPDWPAIAAVAEPGKRFLEFTGARRPKPVSILPESVIGIEDHGGWRALHLSNGHELHVADEYETVQRRIAQAMAGDYDVVPF